MYAAFKSSIGVGHSRFLLLKTTNKKKMEALQIPLSIVYEILNIFQKYKYVIGSCNKTERSIINIFMILSGFYKIPQRFSGLENISKNGLTLLRMTCVGYCQGLNWRTDPGDSVIKYIFSKSFPMYMEVCMEILGLGIAM